MKVRLLLTYLVNLVGRLMQIPYTMMGILFALVATLMGLQLKLIEKLIKLIKQIWRILLILYKASVNLCREEILHLKVDFNETKDVVTVTRRAIFTPTLHDRALLTRLGYT